MIVPTERVEFHLGECREVMRGMEAESVHCCVTSPPYWSLRDYSLAPSLWGGSPDCEHEWGSEMTARQSGGGLALGGNATGGNKDWDLGEKSQGAFCIHCGAWRGCLGLEPTPSCGAAGDRTQVMELREDLSDDERAFVLGELIRRGVIR